MAKSRTLEQVERMQAKAARFLRDVLQDPDRAEEVEAEDPLDYAERKRIRVIDNPGALETVTVTRRTTPMAQVGPTKPELEDTLDELQDVLEDAYNPEATREELAAGIGKAPDIIEGEDEEEPEPGED